MSENGMSDNGHLLEVKGLAVQFKTDEGIVRAVNGIAYELAAGGSLGIVGESGSGKSVSSLALLRLIPQPAGQITGGEVMFGDTNVMDVDPEEIIETRAGRVSLLQIPPNEMRGIRGGRISMIFQDPMSSLNPVLTVGRQIDEAQRLHMGVSKDEARAHTVELLDRVGIPSPAERANDYPHQLSGGMQQRAMIAMAISCEPQLLIADEPTTALDVTIQAQVIELISSLRQELGMARDPDHPRPGARRRFLPGDRGDVRRVHRRARTRPGRVLYAEASVHDRLAGVHAEHLRGAGRQAKRDSRRPRPT